MYCLKNQTKLEEKLGRAVLVKLFEYINQGVIDKYLVKRMCYQHNMNVFNTFDSRKEDERIEVTMERMLDRWYELVVCNLSASEAQLELLRIVEDTCPPLVAAEMFESSYL